MNPVKITLLMFGTLVILAITCVFLVDDVSEKPFAVIIYSFYLAPFVCIIAFTISSFFYHSWIINNKKSVSVVVILLIIWALYILNYLNSLFE